jgi:hypothetical protein
VHDDIRSLFEHIAAYKPRNVELDTRLRCFVPEYIPAVGEIDTFVKVRGGGQPCVRALALPRRCGARERSKRSLCV